VICAFHDGDFKRILPEAEAAMRASGVGDHAWADLAQLDIGAWKGPEYAGQRIPRMSEAYKILRKHPERRFYVDIKNVDLVQLAEESKGSKGAHGQLILASTKYKQIRQWMRLAPDSATLHWMGGTEAELAKRLAELEKVQFADVTQLQIHVRTDKAGVMSPSAEFLLKTGETLRKHGVLFQALAWEHDDAEIHWRLMDLGVASFATDYPDKVMQAIRDYYAAGGEADVSGSKEGE
jgi:glycerophosphoryl diester phosphodiesterase